MNLDSFNIAQYLPLAAKSAPERPAVICRHRPDLDGRTVLTFKELDADSDALAHGLAGIGIRPGDRSLVMVQPGLEFITLTFALFKAGAVPVLIDPGMGKKNLLDCIRQAQPNAFIGVPKAHLVRVLAGGDAFSGIEIHVTVGRRWFWGGHTYRRIRAAGASKGVFAPEATTRESPAAILYTSGSTGIPKGVSYQHGMFGAQVESIQMQYDIRPGEVDLAAFPLFALFDAAFGTTCVIPDMDPTRPAQCDPEKIVRALTENHVTYSFGSPSIWKRVGPYCKAKGLQLPNLKRILMAGAPVRGEVLAPFKEILDPDADTFIPYGATEALPLTSMRGSEVLSETWEQTRQGKGHCVGKPLPGITLKIIRPDEPAPAPMPVPEGDPGCGEWQESQVLPQGEIGEIAVKGAVVTREYFGMPGPTRAAKLIEKPSGEIWHRMGDMGYQDVQGRLWFCGRKAHRVLMADGKVLYSVCVEGCFEALWQKIFSYQLRTALAGIGDSGTQRPCIVLEWTDPQGDADEDWRERGEQLKSELKATEIAWAANNIVTFPEEFPVDVRHNAKINREFLAQWAQANIDNPKYKLI